MTERSIRNAADLDLWITFLGERKLPMTVSCVEGLDRSAAQNKLQFLWAREAAEQLGDRTADEVRCDWKLRHGVPILRSESPQFREVYDQCLKPLPFPMKLKAMQFIPVTSDMKVKQMIAYLDAVERECLEQGVVLTQPDPELRQYHDRYRQRNAA